jgi:integrase
MGGKQEKLQTQANLSPSALRGRGFNVPGSLFKHKHKNLWTVKVSVGNRKYQQRYFTTREEAEAYQASLASHPLHSANIGLYGSSRERLKEHIEHWLRKQKARVNAETLELKSWEEYRGHLTRHVIPDLGWMALGKISPRVLEEHYARLLERGLSSTTVHHIAMILHKVFSDAVRQEVVRQNPCDRVDPPSSRRKEMRVWDLEQARLFLAEARRSSRYFRLYLFLIETGTRPSEALGIRRQDLNLLLGMASVQQKMYRVGKQLVIGRTKTAKSRRAIPLPPVLAEELCVMFAEQDAERRRCGDCQKGTACTVRGCKLWHDYGLAFAQRNGRPLYGGDIRRWDFVQVAKRAKVPRIRLYDLRHCSATLLAAYAPLKVISEHLGHSSVAVTGDIYSHVLPGMQSDALHTLEAQLFRTPNVHLTAGIQREGSGDAEATGAPGGNRESPGLARDL